MSASKHQESCLDCKTYELEIKHKSVSKCGKKRAISSAEVTELESQLELHEKRDAEISKSVDVVRQEMQEVKENRDKELQELNEDAQRLLEIINSRKQMISHNAAEEYDELRQQLKQFRIDKKSNSEKIDSIWYDLLDARSKNDAISYDYETLVNGYNELKREIDDRCAARSGDNVTI